MKKLFGLLFIACASFGAATANAQAILKVDVPFDFVVQGDTLPAASYTISKPLPNDSNGLGFAREGGWTQARATCLDSTMSGTRLEFLKMGEKYFLTDVVTPAGTLHFALSRKQTRIAAGVDGNSVVSVAAD